jgi:hypothetical protein
VSSLSLDLLAPLQQLYRAAPRLVSRDEKWRSSQDFSPAEEPAYIESARQSCIRKQPAPLHGVTATPVRQIDDL